MRSRLETVRRPVVRMARPSDVGADLIGQIIEAHYGAPERAQWDGFRADLPGGMTITELRDFLWSDSDEQQAAVLEGVMTRLEIPIPEEAVLPPRVRIMTMHGAKGLSARIVFIPALEEQIFPGPWRQPFPGLILEAARLLYVSITRARVLCIMSYARKRVINGSMSDQTPSRTVPLRDEPRRAVRGSDEWADGRRCGPDYGRLRQPLTSRNFPGKPLAL